MATAKKMTDTEMDNISKKTAEKAKEKLVTVKIPLKDDKEMNAIVPVCINGYTWLITPGVEVEVPVQVKKLLEKAKYI